MTQCRGCLNAIASEKFLLCQNCNERYHIKCLNIRDDQYMALAREYKSTWLCPACNNLSRRVKINANTPVRKHQLPLDDSSMNMSFDTTDVNSITISSLVHSAPEPEPCSCSSGVTMEKIAALFDEKLNSTLPIIMQNYSKTMKEDMKGLVRVEVSNAVKELKGDLTTATDFFNSEQQTLKSQIADKDATIKLLESKCGRLQSDIMSINNRMISVEKMTRSYNVEIQALPEHHNENVLVLFKKLCDIVNHPIADVHIHACRRIAKMDNTSKRPRNILVTLSSPRLKDSLLSAVRKYNKGHPKDPLNSLLLGLNGETQKIYIVEHLSPECKQLHAAARKFAKDKGYKFVWVKYGRVYLRRDENNGSIYVKDLDSLFKMT